MKTQDFLLELGTEELPPKLLPKLSQALTDNIVNELKSLKLSFSSVESFATPRRLAVLVHDLELQQEDQIIERKGPSVSAPDQAVDGFAKSCGVSKSDLQQKSFGKADYYFFSKEQKGLETKGLLQVVVDTAIKNIPIARPMRWGSSDMQFVRPTHWLVMLLGGEIVEATITGLTAGNTTRGLRFTGKQKFTIDQAKDYRQTMMDQAQIEVDFNLRKEMIRQQVTKVANDNKATAVIDEALLSEVCALVEYPCAFSGGFSESFLVVPEEALISAMKSHQKYFHMLDSDGKLLPSFISVANIESSEISVIIDGNERVIHPRLADSEFFWDQDKCQTLESRLEKLDRVLFMKSLGSMGDKAKRIEELSGSIASMMGANEIDSKRAGLLCKTDLVSEMVGEFADLQGVMGGYYALNDGESSAVATAISEHYHPRFSGDTLPSTPEGLVVAIADKLDTITGIYGIGQGPTGSKDPYALRRMALGLLRIMVESKLKLNLKALISASLSAHSTDVNKDCAPVIYTFMMDRLRAYYKEQKLSAKAFEAVLAVQPESPFDFHLRVEALDIFTKDEASASLIEANKRIANMLKDHQNLSTKVSLSILVEPAEKALFEAATLVEAKLTKSTNYIDNMQQLIALKVSIDTFFDEVMVNAKDEQLKAARLNLINWIRSLFLSVADVSHLS
ncbi:Glycyl-tRNA synthetase beta chain (EC 6.1.1.14) [uncultured Gammaproteobacteria bacterium]|uniref:glycine--tRNA ligase subunit beta n=1 Tax=Bathymodiolus heckerae thiotrophic gill symbiont TaxID=1052212 RepID=UPI0010B5A924|nr:glycine--tRNA ligase subunit beta [Bathymodiolus heckerae thiotrophic gill symbiont]CAC9600913.1 Glycyl-tRNA synthetase beta chain (EC 6.1.1.14) [uncultured Gammaproteobacteria bacterium]SHN89281.1 Glycyl-tRNA synthetase beta chain [Bathymodiolus heckerae thiotrophic gill symbiont]